MAGLLSTSREIVASPVDDDVGARERIRQSRRDFGTAPAAANSMLNSSGGHGRGISLTERQREVTSGIELIVA
jgi:hypothetical protein